MNSQKILKKSSKWNFALIALIILLSLLFISAIISISKQNKKSFSKKPYIYTSLSSPPKSATLPEENSGSAKTQAIENSEYENNRQSFLVTRVLDGDTIEIENGSKVRYIGIDSPELNSRDDRSKCLAGKSKKRNSELVLGKIVHLEKDISEKDKFGRLLRYVFEKDSFINEVLVREGFALSASYPPDIKYQDLFLQAQKSARENLLGLWSSDCLL